MHGGDRARAEPVGTAGPRAAVTRNSRPSSAWAAVAPRHTISSGAMSSISFSPAAEIHWAGLDRRRSP